jgi:hypothetical protein
MDNNTLLLIIAILIIAFMLYFIFLFKFNTRSTACSTIPVTSNGINQYSTGIYPTIARQPAELPHGWDHESPDNTKNVINPILTGGVGI